MPRLKKGGRLRRHVAASLDWSGSNPANGIDPNFLCIQKVLSDCNSFFYGISDATHSAGCREAEVSGGY